MASEKFLGSNLVPALPVFNKWGQIRKDKTIKLLQYKSQGEDVWIVVGVKFLGGVSTIHINYFSFIYTFLLFMWCIALIQLREAL